jgi:hypothetical protein
VPPPYRPCSSCHLAPARRERESEYRGEKLEKRKDRRRESESERRVWEMVTGAHVSEQLYWTSKNLNAFDSKFGS